MRRHHTMITTDWVVMKPTTQVIDLFTPEQFSTTGNQFPLFTCAYKMPGYTFVMHSTKYIIMQDGDGWRGYLEGYPERETYGDSFEELQVKLWQMHQDLMGQETEQDPYQDSQGSEQSWHHNPTPTPTPTKPRRLSRTLTRRKARVEQLLFALISNP